MNLIDIVLLVSAYLVGSIPTGYLIAKRFGNVNIKEVGSGNIGATNLTRVMGKKYGALTLFGDGLKALLFMLATKYLLDFDQLKNGVGDTYNIYILCFCGFSVLLGNCFSVFLKFTGGKGGVTTYGVFLAFAPISSCIAILSYALLGKVFKISAIGTLSSVLVLPLMIFFIYPYPLIKPYILSLAIVFATVVYIRHTKNIKEIFS